MGVTIETLTPGNGKDFPKPGDRIKTHYVGTLIDGTQFDSSRDRGVPFETQIGVGRVIKGWDEGILKLSVGEKAKLTITPDFGYKDLGHPGAETRIPANATLIFEVELLSIVVPT